MVLLIAIPGFLFLGGLGIMMWTDAKCTRRSDNKVDPMFGTKRR